MRLILRAGRERAGGGLVVARFCNQTKTELIVLELMDGQPPARSEPPVWPPPRAEVGATGGALSEGKEAALQDAVEAPPPPAIASVEDRADGGDGQLPAGGVPWWRRPTVASRPALQLLPGQQGGLRVAPSARFAVAAAEPGDDGWLPLADWPGCGAAGDSGSRNHREAWFTVQRWTEGAAAAPVEEPAAAAEAEGDESDLNDRGGWLGLRSCSNFKAARPLSRLGLCLQVCGCAILSGGGAAPGTPMRNNSSYKTPGLVS